MELGSKLIPMENISWQVGNITPWKMSPKAEINLNLGSILLQSITKITTFSLEKH